MSEPTGEPTAAHDPILAAVAGLDPRADGTTAAFAPLDDLADRLGIAADDLLAILADLTAAGLVEVCAFNAARHPFTREDWTDRPRQLFVTLTPYSAGRFGIELDRDGLRWQEAGRGSGPEPRMLVVNGEPVEALETDVGTDFDRMVDPRTETPTGDIDRAERIEQKARGKGGGTTGDHSFLPPPTHLLGFDPPWPLPGHRDDEGKPLPGVADLGRRTEGGGGVTPWKGPCAACLGRPLAAYEYCLACGRWGLDALLRARRPAGPRAEKVRKAYRPDEGLAGGTGAAAAGSRKRARKAHKGQKRGA
jgi:hypothetical protein